MGDQVEGCGPDEAGRILAAIAPLHATYWGDVDRPELSFVPRVNGDLHRNNMSDACGVGWDPCIERFPQAMTPAIRAVRDRFVGSARALHDRVGGLTQTVIHGDLRLDNIMLGQHAGQLPLVILDWQGILVSAGAQDVAYLLTQNLTTEHRREAEHDLLARYHAHLVEGGVAGYSLEQLWEDYRLAALYLFVYAVVIGGTLDPSNERGMAFMAKLMERSTATIEDLDLVALL
jgi:Ser/Thr protein kinase RdoA (MazF antagonist)